MSGWARVCEKESEEREIERERERERDKERDITRDKQTQIMFKNGLTASLSRCSRRQESNLVLTVCAFSGAAANQTTTCRADAASRRASCPASPARSAPRTGRSRRRTSTVTCLVTVSSSGVLKIFILSGAGPRASSRHPQHIHLAPVSGDCVTSHWSAWSECGGCGSGSGGRNGTRIRDRSVVRAAAVRSAEPCGELRESEPCPCYTYHEERLPWSSCEVAGGEACGRGASGRAVRVCVERMGRVVFVQKFVCAHMRCCLSVRRTPLR